MGKQSKLRQQRRATNARLKCPVCGHPVITFAQLADRPAGEVWGAYLGDNCLGEALHCEPCQNFYVLRDNKAHEITAPKSALFTDSDGSVNFTVGFKLMDKSGVTTDES